MGEEDGKEVEEADSLVPSWLSQGWVALSVAMIHY